MKPTDKASEPPSSLQPLVFMIGQDCRGHWVVQESSGARGGLFVSRGEALKFAKSECDSHPHTIVWVSGILELDTGFAPVARFDRQAADMDRRGSDFTFFAKQALPSATRSSTRIVQKRLQHCTSLSVQ